MGKIGVRLTAFLLICLIICGTCLAAQTLVPVGRAVGLQLAAEGIVVAGFEEEKPSPAMEAGLKQGDVIRTVDGAAVNSLAELAEHLKSGKALRLGVKRGEEVLEFTVKPRKDADAYRLGCYVREGISGIGTVTFYDPETGLFGALGHGVSDVTTHELMPIRSGSVIPAQVTEVQRGCAGTPGALRGSFSEDETLGSIEKNTPFGLFGKLTAIPEGEALPIAERDEVQLGAAIIRSNVQGEAVRDYAVRIEKIELDEQGGRNFLIRVIDPVLLEATGGIVQGMSGSPIIQNGKILGAVTHVLVNDPTRGYGIYIDNMLRAAA